MSDVKVELLEVKEESDTGAARPLAGGSREQAGWGAAGLGAAVVLGALAWNVCLKMIASGETGRVTIDRAQDDVSGWSADGELIAVLRLPGPRGTDRRLPADALRGLRPRGGVWPNPQAFPAEGERCRDSPAVRRRASSS
jgi:hypothetical protein